MGVPYRRAQRGLSDGRSLWNRWFNQPAEGHGGGERAAMRRPTDEANGAPQANPTRPNSSLRPSTTSPAASAPSVSPAATAQKLWSIEPSAYRITAAIVVPARAENTAVAAIRIRT